MAGADAGERSSCLIRNSAARQNQISGTDPIAQAPIASEGNPPTTRGKCADLACECGLPISVVGEGRQPRERAVCRETFSSPRAHSPGNFGPVVLCTGLGVGVMVPSIFTQLEPQLNSTLAKAWCRAGAAAWESTWRGVGGFGANWPCWTCGKETLSVGSTAGEVAG